MTTPKYHSHKEARENGWFSRRHQTNEPHRTAQDTYRYEQEQKLAAARQRQEEAEKRTPAQRLAELDTAFGHNMGAQRERARLKKRLA